MNYNQVEGDFKDYKELLELAYQEESKKSDQKGKQIENQKQNKEEIELIEAELTSIAKSIKKLETHHLFSGENDENDCFLEIQAGAGGTESQDWAEMLLRMYMRFAQLKSFNVEIMSMYYGEEAGVKSVTLKIKGYRAFGWLRTETGVHRLVRLSPFNSSGKRMTSFASILVYPVIDDKIDVEILDKDLKIDTFRASGAGGQHVNTTDSAVRITHIPTAITVQCQNNRSQHQNKNEAMRILRSRLYKFLLEKQEAEKNNTDKTEIGWGHQIRSYVLQPYHMVKDLRTNYSTSQVDAVLDGDLEEMLLTTLSHNLDGK